MSVFVKLNKLERMIARVMEMEIKLALGIPAEEAEEQVTGIREGAKLAVAKALNLYPMPLAAGHELISMKRQKITLVISKKKRNLYGLKDPLADVFVLVYCNPVDTYEIVGYAKKSNVMRSENDLPYIYDHVFQSFIDKNIFMEVIDT